jgi:hypothetical protein
MQPSWNACPHDSKLTGRLVGAAESSSSSPNAFRILAACSLVMDCCALKISAAVFGFALMSTTFSGGANDELSRCAGEAAPGCRDSRQIAHSALPPSHSCLRACASTVSTARQSQSKTVRFAQHRPSGLMRDRWQEVLAVSACPETLEIQPSQGRVDCMRGC